MKSDRINWIIKGLTGFLSMSLSCKLGDAEFNSAPCFFQCSGVIPGLLSALLLDIIPDIFRDIIPDLIPLRFSVRFSYRYLFI
jgi:hypothetical protein